MKGEEEGSNNSHNNTPRWHIRKSNTNNTDNSNNNSIHTHHGQIGSSNMINGRIEEGNDGEGGSGNLDMDTDDSHEADSSQGDCRTLAEALRRAGLHDRASTPPPPLPPSIGNPRGK